MRAAHECIGHAESHPCWCDRGRNHTWTQHRIDILKREAAEAEAP